MVAAGRGVRRCLSHARLLGSVVGWPNAGDTPFDAAQRCRLPLVDLDVVHLAKFLRPWCIRKKTGNRAKVRDRVFGGRTAADWCPGRCQVSLTSACPAWADKRPSRIVSAEFGIEGNVFRASMYCCRIVPFPCAEKVSKRRVGNVTGGVFRPPSLCSGRFFEYFALRSTFLDCWFTTFTGLAR